MVLDMIQSIGRPEIIGLLETDLTRLFTGNRDLIEYLSEVGIFVVVVCLFVCVRVGVFFFSTTVCT
jgi:hypothetical protein